jgi:pyruvate dehydrogenase E2 component (dihydrolipoamide acetyltransferase)
MPSLGADMDAGIILEWRVQPGDAVRRGQIVALVETEKADIEVEVFTDGVIERLVVPEGEKVPVGTVLAIIGDGSAHGTVDLPTELDLPADADAPDDAPADAGHVTSPLVRHRAEELGVDLAHVVGSGPGGRITRADVEAAAPTPVGAEAAAPTAVGAEPAAPDAAVAPAERAGRRPRISPRARRLAAEGHAAPEPEVVPASPPASPAAPSQPAPPSPPARSAAGGPKASMRLAVGRTMARSKREIPHYYLSLPVDLGPALGWLDQHNADRTVADRVLPAAMLLHAVARAVSQHSCMNGTFDASTETHGPNDQVDLAVAIALREGGLVAPVIPAAQALTLDELMASLKDLVARARRSSLRGSDLVPGTITVTSLGEASPGSAGVAQLFPVITPPQVAAVGIGAIREQPWARDGMLGVHPVVWISLAADHRVSDGRDGARFLSTLDEILSRPDQFAPDLPGA